MCTRFRRPTALSRVRQRGQLKGPVTQMAAECTMDRTRPICQTGKIHTQPVLRVCPESYVQSDFVKTHGQRSSPSLGPALERKAQH